jgi:RNA polymerase sigma-70 factor (ECF subfamily)
VEVAESVGVARVQTDEDVIASVRAGDSALYETLVRRYDRFLHYMTLKVVHDEADADDLVQDAHMKAFTNLSQFAGRSCFATWLTTIAIHGAVAHVRKTPHRLARSGAFLTIEDSETRMTTTAPDPEQQVLDDEARRALRAAVVALPTNYRAVVILRGIKELPTGETARILGISPQSVKMRLHRAKTLLRADLAKRLGTRHGGETADNGFLYRQIARAGQRQRVPRSFSTRG